MTIETTIHRGSGGFSMIESTNQTTVRNTANLAFTNTARTSMEDLHASEETIRQCITHADSVLRAFAREPDERVVQITKLDLHVVYNESTQLVVDVKENWDYVPNDPMVIERGEHPEDRGMLRDLYLGLRVRLPSSAGVTATVQRLRNKARLGRWFPPFEIRSSTVGRTAWLGRQE
jgi:hypothetical protein